MMRAIAMIIIGIWISLATGVLAPGDLTQALMYLGRRHKAIFTVLSHHQAPLAAAEEDNENDD